MILLDYRFNKDDDAECQRILSSKHVRVVAVSLVKRFLCTTIQIIRTFEIATSARETLKFLFKIIRAKAHGNSEFPLDENGNI